MGKPHTFSIETFDEGMKIVAPNKLLWHMIMNVKQSALTTSDMIGI